MYRDFSITLPPTSDASFAVHHLTSLLDDFFANGNCDKFVTSFESLISRAKTFLRNDAKKTAVTALTLA